MLAAIKTELSGSEKTKVNKNMYISSIRVMLYGTIRNDDF